MSATTEGQIVPLFGKPYVWARTERGALSLVREPEADTRARLVREWQVALLNQLGKTGRVNTAQGIPAGLTGPARQRMADDLERAVRELLDAGVADREDEGSPVLVTCRHPAP